MEFRQLPVSTKFRMKKVNFIKIPTVLRPFASYEEGFEHFNAVHLGTGELTLIPPHEFVQPIYFEDPVIQNIKEFLETTFPDMNRGEEYTLNSGIEITWVPYSQYEFPEISVSKILVTGDNECDTE